MYLRRPFFRPCPEKKFRARTRVVPVLPPVDEKGRLVCKTVWLKNYFKSTFPGWVVYDDNQPDGVIINLRYLVPMLYKALGIDPREDFDKYWVDIFLYSVRRWILDRLGLISPEYRRDFRIIMHDPKGIADITNAHKGASKSDKERWYPVVRDKLGAII